jgi:hypothetical protein
LIASGESVGDELQYAEVKEHAVDIRSATWLDEVGDAAAAGVVTADTVMLDVA